MNNRNMLKALSSIVPPTERQEPNNKKEQPTKKRLKA